MSDVTRILNAIEQDDTRAGKLSLANHLPLRLHTAHFLVCGTYPICKKPDKQKSGAYLDIER